MIDIPFIKMQAQGNDFLIIQEHILAERELYPLLARDICDRHFGMGADGLVVFGNTGNGTPSMNIWNADGSYAEMCGSALRCIAVLFHQQTGKAEFPVQTGNGILQVSVNKELPTVSTVQMGMPQLMQESLTVMGYTGSYINVGNPHFVVYQDSASEAELLDIGSSLSTHPAFPQGTNVEFVECISSSEIKILVWERGAGATLACGTGATASVYAGITTGRLQGSVLVHVPGGDVTIIPREDSYYLCGETGLIGQGIYRWKA